MKKLMYSLFATALVVLSGCQDDVVEQKPSTPAQVGDEISFGSSLRDVQTRTIYDDEPTQSEDGSYYYRVRWEEGDQIAIYCPQASNGTLVNYSVSPDANDPTRSSRVTKVNTDEPGLQWGESDEHHFYGFYPANRVTGTEKGLIKGYVPTEQSPIEWNEVTNNGGTNFYGKTNTDNAYMWAYGKFTKTMGGQDVPLTFHPWMTVLQIKIPGPTSGTMKISNVNIIATEGEQTAIAGDFVCDMTPVEENGADGVPVYRTTTEGAVTNTISISGWNSAVQDFVELDSPNDTMIVRAYLLPIDENLPSARNLQIAVQTMNGAPLTRTLGYSGVGENSIQPHKVNTVILPNLTESGQTNYWMSSLDRNIYLSELSIPGSKFSYLTPTNAGGNAAFQGEGIEQQFLDGVRGFIVQVGANATYNATRTGSWPFYRYSYEYTGATLPIFCGNGDMLSDAITSIANALSTAEQELGQDRNLECAVVMITYTGDNAVSADFTGDGYSHGIGDVGGAEHVWMDAIANELKKLGANDANRIYKDEITANTTLDDVKGKIILKVNTNSDAQNGYIVADDNVPALFSRWNGVINTVDLRWGSPNTNSTRTPLKWMYQEATHIGTGSNEGTPQEKYNNAMSVFQNSIDEYTANSAHDTWFMNDCGGTFHGNVSGTDGYDRDYGNGDTNDDAPIAFARWFNPQITRYLQERDANASLGLVFFNFADKQTTGQQYGTDNLIQSIIDNNFKFNLRKEGSSTDTNNSSLSNSGSGYGNGGALIK